MSNELVQIIPVEEIENRLLLIFPEGMDHRNYLTRKIAARSIFVFIYINAVEGAGVYLNPKHIYKMTDEQSSDLTKEARIDYRKFKLSETTQNGSTTNSWYADTSREPIRDETLKEGFVSVGAVKVLEGIPTTSSKPRYYLQSSFAALFNPILASDELERLILEWQEKNLSTMNLNRLKLVKRLSSNSSSVIVRLPNGESIALGVGPSSEIAKHVIEEFALKFLEEPLLLWLSESGNKKIDNLDSVAKAIGLNIQTDRHLPDLILVDVANDEFHIFFIEVVATDGPINENRKEALLKLASGSGVKPEKVHFITAFADRTSSAFKKSISTLAWNSYAWFASEPEKIFYLSSNPFKINQVGKLY